MFLKSCPAYTRQFFVMIEEKKLDGMKEDEHRFRVRGAS
jgi:hypothetical protein